MTHRGLESRSTMESFTKQLHSWRPFQLPSTAAPPPKTLDSDSPKPYASAVSAAAAAKRPCRADRATSFPIDLSKLSLLDDDRPLSSSTAVAHHKRDGLRFFARKRRRRESGSRSVSGRSSDRSGTRRRCCSVGASAAYGTCSDFPVAVGTDSSGELFMNGEANWASDVSEAARNGRRENKDGGSGEKENLSGGFGHIGNFDSQGNESGYGSEPGYRGDAELGYGDELDEEEDDPRIMLWGDEFRGIVSTMEKVGENTLQKAHHRCRRKKNDFRMVDPLR